MQWLKTRLRKWLGVEATSNDVLTLASEVNAEVGLLRGEFVKVGLRIENLREHYASVKGMGEACMARLDRETMKLATAIDEDRTAVRALRAELIDIVKVSECESKKISKLETIVKDGTIDTALAELEDRVAKIENAPTPESVPAPHGRRGGSAWSAHQVAASAGAARANGFPEVPIPVPGVS